MSVTVAPKKQESRSAEQEAGGELGVGRVAERGQGWRTADLVLFASAFFALAGAIFAVVLALTEHSASSPVAMMRGANGYMTHRQGTMGSGMMSGGGASNAAPAAAAGSRTVNVQLGEMFVRPSVSKIGAGKVTFVAHNGGRMTHELMVERAPIKMDAPGQPNEDAAMGMINDMSPGQSGRMTLKLSPGTYELFCNIPGHYAMGQHTTFTVTRS